MTDKVQEMYDKLPDILKKRVDMLVDFSKLSDKKLDDEVKACYVAYRAALIYDRAYNAKKKKGKYVFTVDDNKALRDACEGYDYRILFTHHMAISLLENKKKEVLTFVSLENKIATETEMEDYLEYYNVKYNTFDDEKDYHHCMEGHVLNSKLYDKDAVKPTYTQGALFDVPADPEAQKRKDAAKERQLEGYKKYRYKGLRESHIDPFG